LNATALGALETALSTAISDLDQLLLHCRTEPEDVRSGARVDIFWLAPPLVEVASAWQSVRNCLKYQAAAHGATVNLTEIASNALLRGEPTGAQPAAPLEMASRS
jgi:hypothetical protein